MQKSIFAQTLFDKSMESKLIVKNFGPIKHVELDLRNVNVFIGPQASGKSALAKLFTIFKAPRKFFYKNNPDAKELVIDNAKATSQVVQVFEGYNIDSFLEQETEIVFESQLHTISFDKGVLEYTPKLFNKLLDIERLAKNFGENKDEIISAFKSLAKSFIYFHLKAEDILVEGNNKSQTISSIIFDNLTELNYESVLNLIKETESELSTNAALYIPSERNFINIIKQYALNLIQNKVPIPEHILNFGAELEKLNVKEIDLGFIQKGLKYKNVNGEDKIFINDERSIFLKEAASGIQSVVPVLAPIISKKNIIHRSFVIEEPELNLFPFAQYELIQCLESNRQDYNYWEDIGTIHTYTTHSPYILSALNNLLYAYKVRYMLLEKSMDGPFSEIDKKNDKIIKKIVKAYISPDYFTAYQISDGYAQSIFNREKGLIEDNYIDEASDKINEDFEALMELTK